MLTPTLSRAARALLWARREAVPEAPTAVTTTASGALAASLTAALEPSFPKLVPFSFKLQRRKSWHELPGSRRCPANLC